MAEATEELRLELLGGWQLSRGGAPLTGFAYAKGQALLAYLAATGRPHAREALAALLWGDLPESDARRNLREVLSDLRRVVGSHLVITRATVALDGTAPYWLDVAAFEAGVDSATAASDADALRSAIALYEDDFLAGFALPDAPDFDPWSLLRREHLRDRLLGALQALTDLHIGRGETAAGIASATLSWLVY